MKTLKSLTIALPGLALLTALMLLTLAGCDTQTSYSPAQAAQTQPSSLPTPRPIHRPGNTTPIPHLVVRKADYGAWSYTVSRGGPGVTVFFGGIATDNGDASGRVLYDNRSINGIRNYAAANRQLVPQVAAHGGLAEVLITFHSYVPIEQFRTWVKAHDLAVTLTYVNVVSTNGEHSRMMICPYSDYEQVVSSDKAGFPLIYCPYYYVGKDPQGKLGDKGNPFPPSELNSDIAEYNVDAKYIKLNATLNIVGVSFTRAWVDSSQLTAIANDPLVYLADVTPDAVRMDLAKAGVADAGTTAIEVDTPFPAMEHFGLDSFK